MTPAPKSSMATQADSGSLLMSVVTSRMPRALAIIAAGWSVGSERMARASMLAFLTAVRSLSSALGRVLEPSVGVDKGMSTMLMPCASTTSLRPVRNSTANGSENAYESRSDSSTPTASARPIRSVRPAASGPG